METVTLLKSSLDQSIKSENRDEQGRGNPWGVGVRVYKGKGGGLDFQTPDPSRYP